VSVDLAPGCDARRARTRKTDLNLLWQEWQVVAQARQRFVALTLQRRLMHVLRQSRALLVDRGLLTLDVVTPHLVALQDVSRQINDLERLTSQRRHDLHALLGVAPRITPAAPLRRVTSWFASRNPRTSPFATKLRGYRAPPPRAPVLRGGTGHGRTPGWAGQGSISDAAAHATPRHAYLNTALAWMRRQSLPRRSRREREALLQLGATAVG
jgi:hypothetical protein